MNRQFIEHSRCWAIIPAAGIGTRMQADRPKQYLTLQKKPLLTHVVDLFSAQSFIEKVVVVLNAKDHWWSALSLSHPQKVLTAIGGKERVHSVLLGLAFLTDFASEEDWVLVHDAARPCLQSQDILRLIQELRDHPVGGLLGMPVVDTLKRVNQNDDIIETVSRNQLWQAQTPQCFRYGILKKAIENALDQQQVVTDESSAVELLGLKPKMILGDARNMKITFPEDLALVERLMR
jgi:2-C-methyl-D-erythritol 4-phosphate cytidylyltransferase